MKQKGSILLPRVPEGNECQREAAWIGLMTPRRPEQVTADQSASHIQEVPVALSAMLLLLPMGLGTHSKTCSSATFLTWLSASHCGASHHRTGSGKSVSSGVGQLNSGVSSEPTSELWKLACRVHVFALHCHGNQ